MVNIFETLKKLREFYGSNLNFTNIKILNVGISILIFVTVISGHTFTLQGIVINMNFISISDAWKSIMVLLIILHLYGFQRFSQKIVKERILTPEVETMNCPKCKIPMITHILKCQQCGKTF